MQEKVYGVRERLRHPPTKDTAEYYTPKEKKTQTNTLAAQS